MKNEELDALVGELNELSIKGYENIRWGDVLFYSLYFFEKKKPIYEIKAILAPILRGRYWLECKGNSGLLFLFSSSYSDRKDHREKFNNVTSLVKEKSVLVYGKGTYFKNVFKLYHIVAIYKKIKELSITNQLKRFISYWIYTYMCEQSEIDAILKKQGVHLKAIISYCDVMPADSLLIQYYNSLKVKTITLQHGQFNVENEKGRAAYEKSHSDLFLCFGDYTKQTCKNVQIKQEKMIPLGPPEIIGKELPNQMIIKDNRSFGVVMSFFENEEENIRLLKCAAAVNRETGYMMKIRLHPSLELSSFSEYITEENVYVCDKDEPMEEFIKNVDFAIVGTSSVFQSFILMLVPIFRCILPGEEDPYRGIDWCVFSEEDDGIYKIKEFLNNPKKLESMLIETRKTLIGDGNVALNYKHFFEKLVLESNET